MKKYLPLIALLSLIKLVIHLIGNRNYGFHRDELLHLSASEQLDFGYYEFPPFIAVIGKFAHFLFGYSVSGIRIFATLAGIGILFLCCKMVKEFGGKSKSIFLAGICILAFLPFWRNHLLFQPVAFDQFFWTLGFYLLIKFINTENNKYLIWLGIAAGFGLMNKYTFLVWGFGIAVGILFYQKGKLLRNQSLYIAALLVILIGLPNFIWQYNHHFPLLTHMAKLKEIQTEEASPFDFVLDQVEFLFTFILSLIGLFAFFFDSQLKRYKTIGVAVIIIFATMWFMQSKGYYFFAVYPVLFAAGSVKIEHWLQRKPKWNYAVAALLLAPAIYFLPMAIPILPIEQYVKYADLKPQSDGRIILSDDYADMFGWEEQAAFTDSIYQSLSPQDKANCVIWAENYGEAGALKVLGEQYDLPNPISIHGSFWSWGTGNTSRNVCLSIGNEKEVLEHFYADLTLLKTIKHKYAIDEENNIPIYLCRNPKIDLKQKWPELEKYIFE